MDKIWNVLNKSHGKNMFDVGNYALLILNQPIKIPGRPLIDLWNNARYRVTVDGGTNRWFDFVSSLSETASLKQIFPDLTCGDFDSIHPKSLERCRANNVKVVETPDQDKTDFHKALEETLQQTNNQVDSIIAVVENSGRFDHIMSNTNTLYIMNEIYGSSGLKLYLLSRKSLTWLLEAGLHTIHIPQILVEAQAACGLIPVGGSCTVTTTGLKWNLKNDQMRFGGLISTCNTYSKDCNELVTVDTNSPVLWTMSLRFSDS